MDFGSTWLRGVMKCASEVQILVVLLIQSESPSNGDPRDADASAPDAENPQVNSKFDFQILRLLFGLIVVSSFALESQGRILYQVATDSEQSEMSSDILRLTKSQIGTTSSVSRMIH
jgi:hypothetical protein